MLCVSPWALKKRHNKQSIGKTQWATFLWQVVGVWGSLTKRIIRRIIRSKNSMGQFSCLGKMFWILKDTHLRSLKMTASDIALAVQVVASLKTHAHQVTVAGTQGVFGQHHYI